jgi:hypothetical protein
MNILNGPSLSNNYLPKLESFTALPKARGGQDPPRTCNPAPWNTGFSIFTAGTSSNMRDPHGAGRVAGPIFKK